MASCPCFSETRHNPQIWVKCKLIQAIADNNYHPTYVYVQQTRREFNKTWMCLPPHVHNNTNKGHCVHGRCVNLKLSQWTGTWSSTRVQYSSIRQQWFTVGVMKTVNQQFRNMFDYTNQMINRSLM